MGIDCSCCCLGFQFHFKKDRDMISTNALAIGTSAAVVILAVSDFGTRQYHRIFRDNLTPLVSTTRVLPDKITAAPGDVFSVNYDYFRRPGCVGTVEYRLEGVPKGWSHPVSIPIGNFNAGWEEGSGKETARVVIPQDMWGGEYQFVFITRADTCESKGGYKASTKPIMHRSKPVSVTIVKG